MLACLRIYRAHQGMALARRNRGSVAWTGLSGSQSGSPGALTAWDTPGDGGIGPSALGHPSSSLTPSPLLSWLHLRQNTVWCGRKNPKAARQIFSDLAGSVFFYLYKRPKHLRSFRENRAALFIHLPLW